MTGFMAYGWSDDNDISDMYVVAGVIISGAILWMIFVYTMRRRATSLARSSAINTRCYDQCIEIVASASGIHKYSFDGIRKIVHELIDDLRK